MKILFAKNVYNNVRIIMKWLLSNSVVTYTYV